MQRVLLLGLFLILAFPALAQDRVMMQGFYWDSYPGGVWYDTLITRASQLGAAKFDAIWLAPPSKGAASGYDVGYTPYDYYDLGEYDSCGGNYTQGQGGCIPTRYGTRRGLEEAVRVLKLRGLDVYTDVVLNHRSGGSLETNDYGQYYNGGGSLYGENGKTYTAFPLTHGSGRVAWPAGSGDEYFFPNASNNPGNTFDFYADNQLAGFHQMYVNSFAYDNALHNGAGTNLPVGDSLIAWGNWLTNTLDLDGYRFDFVKGIHPEYLKRWVNSGAMAGNFHVHELYDGDINRLKTYAGQVGATTRAPAVFDFNMRFAYKDVLDHGAPIWRWHDSGLMNQFGFPFEQIVTFVDNHDFDRLNFEGQITVDGHSPVVNNKMLAYAHMLTHPGTATVWWRDYYQYGLRPQIEKLIRYRKAYASGSFWTLTRGSTGSPFWPGSNPANPWEHLYVAQRNGTGGQTGLIVAINKHPSQWAEVWVTQQNGAWTNQLLKDVTGNGGGGKTQIFGDNRVRFWAPPLSYTIWVPDYNQVPAASAAPVADQPTYYDVDWANLQTPATIEVPYGQPASFSARAYVHGITDEAGQGGGVSVSIGYSTSDTDPSTWTNWVDASYSSDEGHLDEYEATLSDLLPGTYYVASRIRYAGKDAYYGGYSDPHGGFWDGSSHASAVLTVAAPVPDGFLTGGGWISSPAGAYPASPSHAGRAHLTVDARYEDASYVPATGVTFELKGLSFASARYDLFSIDGQRAELIGAGTIGGAGEYGFTLTVLDGGKTGDAFRMQIWASDGSVVYDNQLGSADESAPTLIGGGQLKIHRDESAGKNVTEKPSAFALHQNYPNPFNPSTLLSFDLPQTEHVRLEIFDITGRTLGILIDRPVEAGTHSVTWNAGDLPSGVYVARISAGGFTASSRIVLAK